MMMNRDFIQLSGRTISAPQFLSLRQAHELVQDYALYQGRHLGNLSDADSYVSEAFGEFTLQKVSNLTEDFEVERLERIAMYSSIEEYDRYEGDDC